MRRPAVLALLALAAAAAAGPSPAVAAPPAEARLLACETGPAPADRAALFEARMERMPGAERLSLRFTLQERAGERRRWRAVEAAGFGVWLTAEPGVSRFVYAKRVEGLLAPARYRSTVAFRWLDADGRVVARARRRSRPCAQPDLRADLRVLSLAVRPAGDDRARWIARVRNTGRGPARPFAVLFALDREAAGEVALAGLPALRTARVEVLGPACAAGRTALVHADTHGAVPEARESDNVRSRPCREGGRAALH